MAPSETLRASSETSPAAAGAKSCASSTTTSIGYQKSRSASKRPPRKAAAQRICASVSRPSRLETTETRCWRTRAAMRCRSPSLREASTTTWPNLSARVTKSPSGIDDGLLDEVGALLEQAAQEMRLARAGIALDEQTRRQKLLQIEQSRLSSGGGGCRSHVDADLHQPPSCSYGKIRLGPNTAKPRSVPHKR